MRTNDELNEQHHAMVDWHCVCYCAELDTTISFSQSEEYFVRARHVIIVDVTRFAL